MDHSIEEHGPTRAVIKFKGRIDAHTSQTVKDVLKTTIASGRKQVIIDMGEVTFLDSSGLSALVSAFRSVREQNGILLLANVGAQSKVAFTQTRLDQVFPIYNDVAAALKSLN